MDMPTAFQPTERSRVKRLHERAHYDRETIYAILDSQPICHVAYVIDGQPHVTPTCFWREGDRLFWHGSSASRMLRTVSTGVPVSLNVFNLDGFVLARSGFHSSINYRSVTAFGHAVLIEDKDAKLAALKAFVDGLWPGRWPELAPVKDQELKATTVVSMEIEEASAKVRTGPPNDEPEDYALDVWAGVHPIRQVVEAPESDPKLKAGVAVPTYLGGFTIGE
jgi:hypothetical protein